MRSNSAPEETWSITNGVVHCTGQPAGYMRTLKSYHDYHLTVEWRFVEIKPQRDNTGVLVNMQLPDEVWPKCIECQGQYQKQGDFWLHSDASAGGYLGNPVQSVHVPMHVRQNEKPPGEWSTYEVIVSKDSVEIMVNGKPMNKIIGCKPSSGFIGIQSEGAEIEIRKIEIEPLADSTTNM